MRLAINLHACTAMRQSFSDCFLLHSVPKHVKHDNNVTVDHSLTRLVHCILAMRYVLAISHALYILFILYGSVLCMTDLHVKVPFIVCVYRHVKNKYRRIRKPRTFYKVFCFSLTVHVRSCSMD